MEPCATKINMLLLSDINITIKGNFLKYFEYVTINENIYGIDSFEITCLYSNIEKPDGFLIENAKGYLGADVTIQTKVKTGSGEKDALTFRGIVTEVKGTRCEMADDDRVVISGGSMEILLNGKPKSRAFTDKTLGDIVNEVLMPYPADKFGKKISVRDTFQYPFIVQYKESDLEFLKRLSIRYGEWFFFDGKDMVFGELPKNSIDVTIGLDVKELSYQLKIHPVSFTLQSVDPLKRDLHSQKAGGKGDSNLNSYGKDALGKAKSAFPVAGMDYYEYVNVEDASYQQCLEKVVERDEISDAVNLSDIAGSGTSPWLTPGVIMKVSCLNPDPKATGKISYLSYRVTSVQHHFDNQNSYENSFTAIPVESAIPENTDPYYIKTAHNQVGIIKDNNDPENLGRVRINFWWMNDDSLMTPWVKVVTPFTEKDSGFYFVPAIDSRILAGFEGGDVEKPYCMGALFDKVHSPDAAWTGNGDAKVYAIRTVSGQTIEFHDKSGGEKITIYDTGKKNEITLDTAKGEITIKATEKLTIEAKEIEIKSQMGMKIEAGQSLEQKGMDVKTEAQTSMELKATSVEIKANASLKAEGSASAEVSSSGVMTVKGSMVMIN